MNERNYEIYIQPNPAIRGYDIWVTATNVQGEPLLAQPIELVFKADNSESRLYAPTFVVPNREQGFLSAFARALSQSGFMPDDLKKKDGEIAAIKYHLEDMRTLALRDRVVKGVKP